MCAIFCTHVLFCFVLLFSLFFFFFFFNDTATTEIYTLSLHDALPILSDVLSGVLGLCARVGLASVGVIAIDGTKLSANASVNANRDFAQLARTILREAAEVDQREDELYGDARGDELPEQLRTREGRRQA